MKVKAFIEGAKRAEAQLAESAAAEPQSTGIGPYDWAEDE
jgi:hypothetical protein